MVLLTRRLEARAQQALGVLEANVVRKGEDKFIIELPGFKNEEEARKIITTSARLEFYWPRNVQTDRTVAGRRYRHDQITDPQTQEKVDVFYNAITGEQVEPGSPEWERMISSWKFITGGETLRYASVQPAMSGTGAEIHLQFDPDGARELDKFARQVLNKGEPIAAMLDNRIVSYAVVQDNITSFNGQPRITGNFTVREAQQTTELLNAGALPVDLVEDNIAKVNPQIGREALSQIITAGAAAFVVISAFLLIYYVFPGFVAFIALLIYASLCYAVFKWIGVTFSLAAIAGFILSIGMAVDANILIFERLKEELRNGRQLLTAIDLGFKRAFPAILDSNACTIITTVVLINIGTGPVKGFATTLMIGVLLSLFTAVTVTRSLLVFFVSAGIGKNQNLYGLKRSWFGEKFEARANEEPLHISRRMGRYFLISFLIIVPGLIFMAMGGIRPNVEFRGGVESTVLLPQGAPATSASVNAKLQAAGIRGANTKIGEPSAQYNNRPVAYITISPEDNPQIAQLLDSPNTEEKLKARQQIVAAAGASSEIVTRKDETGQDVMGIEDELGFESTGPAVREETIRGAIIGMVVSSLLIVLYLAIRFGVALGGFIIGLRFGTSAIIAMIHDVFVILGLSAITGYLLNWEVSQLTITAVLTVIGFSVHDTIVIFDRIRENLRRPMPGETFDNLVDRSITQSIARSINTSATVVVTLAILVLFGSATPDLKHFNAAMLVGILSGTYSSIFNAAPILVLWERSVGKRKGHAHTVMQNQKLREPAPTVKDETVWEGEETKPKTQGRYSQTKRKKK